MSKTVASTRVKIINPQGLHARPADLFVKIASQFQSDIEVAKDGEKVNGKSILGILTLVAEQGSELSIEARGPDADDALQALADLIKQGFSEDEHITK